MATLVELSVVSCVGAITFPFIIVSPDTVNAEILAVGITTVPVNVGDANFAYAWFFIKAVVATLVELSVDSWVTVFKLPLISTLPFIDASPFINNFEFNETSPITDKFVFNETSPVKLAPDNAA